MLIRSAIKPLCLVLFLFTWNYVCAENIDLFGYVLFIIISVVVGSQQIRLVFV